MKILNWYAFALIAMLFAYNASAQTEEEKESPFSVGADVVSRYVWRGLDFGSSPSIQPNVEYSKGGFAIGAWGAYTTNGNQTQEADLYLSYTFLDDKFTIMATDYFFPVDGMDNCYFDYTDTTTSHVMEVSASFNGTESLPLSFLVAVNVYGADAKKANNDNAYSTYLELAYEFKNLKVFGGFNLIAPDRDKGESGFYGDYMGFTNIGVSSGKEIKITDKFSLPLTVSLITNPMRENIFLVVGASF